MDPKFEYLDSFIVYKNFCIEMSMALLNLWILTFSDHSILIAVKYSIIKNQMDWLCYYCCLPCFILQFIFDCKFIFPFNAIWIYANLPDLYLSFLLKRSELKYFYLLFIIIQIIFTIILDLKIGININLFESLNSWINKIYLFHIKL